MRGVTGRFERVVAAVGGLGLILSLATAGPADARTRHVVRHVAARHHVRPAAVNRYAPPFAAMVVDGNSGKTLYAVNENELRHPASITKVMTLYLLFEQIEKGRLSLSDEIEMSAHAASMAPSKLGLRPGSTLTVEDAIKAVVTKSANDVAVAIAEAIGGSEEHFAELMTAKGRQLGMSRTVYVNASGLPDDDQVTTARDLTLLGRAIQDRYPRYYSFFSTPAFRFAGRSMRNHNNLLGRVEGMDGIKTGYTRASGFNLLSSVKRGNRRLVSVVLGGASAGVRDRIMAGLIEEHLAKASSLRTTPLIAEAAPSERIEKVAKEIVKPQPVREDAPDLPRADIPQKTVPVAYAAVDKPRPAFVAATPRVEEDATASTGATPDRKRIVIDGSTGSQPVGASMTTPTPLRWVTGAAPARQTARIEPPLAVPAHVAPARTVTETKVAKVEPPKAQERPAAARSGVQIQIGATDDAGKANDLLAKARSQSRRLLAAATPYTEKVQKGGETLWRARFAGLDSDRAEQACKELKRSGFACFTTRN